MNVEYRKIDDDHYEVTANGNPIGEVKKERPWWKCKSPSAKHFVGKYDNRRMATGGLLRLSGLGLWM